MKSMIEEYGKIVVFTLIAVVFVYFALSRETVQVTNPTTGEVVEQPVGFLAMLKEIKPAATVGTRNSSDLLKEMAENKEYIKENFKVVTKKLHMGEEHNLSEYVTYSLNINGEPLSVSVLSVTEESTGKTIPVREENKEYIASFLNSDGEFSPGRYIVDYQVLDKKQDLKLIFKYAFVVD